MSKSATNITGAIGAGTGISFCARSHTRHTAAQKRYSYGAGRSMQRPLQQASSLCRALLMNRDSAAVEKQIMMWPTWGIVDP